jgi:tetratricopeptide (TPR) repeat protein
LARPPAPAARLPDPDHAIDAAVRHLDPARVAEADRPAVQAVLKAFAHYAEGKDDEARAALEPIGARSPLADWKLLIRGLIAYSTGDDTRAVDNWRRLAADRLPYRLAMPLRARLDPAFATNLPPADGAKVRAMLLDLEGDPLSRGLADLQQNLGRDQPLSKAFNTLDKLVPLLKAKRPDLVPRLAKAVYWAVQKFGEPQDVPKVARAFGKPPDDPDFHRLNAMNYERGSPGEAIGHWLKYEKWLATNPPGVPAATGKQARVWVLRQAGRLTLLLNEQPEGFGDGLEDIVRQMFGGRPPKGLENIRVMKAPAPKGTPDGYWRQALALDPANESVAVALVEYLRDHKQAAAALKVADDFLAGTPDSLPVIGAAVVLHLAAGDPGAAMARLKQAHKLNPLDGGIRKQVQVVSFGVVRGALATGKPAAVRAALDEARTYGGGGGELSGRVIEAILALKASDPAAADLEAAALGDPADEERYWRVALTLAADAVVAKLKPAQKKPLDARLAPLFAAQPPDGVGVKAAVGLLGTVSLYKLTGVAYRGLPTHIKKVGDFTLKTATADKTSPPEAFLEACTALRVLGLDKVLEKFADALIKRFPKNPFFAVFAAEAVWWQAEVADRPPAYRKLDGYSRKAERASLNSPPEVRKQVLERLDEIDGTNTLDAGDDFFF